MFLLNCKAFGGSRVKTRRCTSSQEDLYLEQTCRGLRLEMISRGKKMYFEQTCLVYLFVRPSVGRGLRLEDVSRGKKTYYLIVRPSVGRGSRREDVSRQDDVY